MLSLRFILRKCYMRCNAVPPVRHSARNLQVYNYDVDNPGIQTKLDMHPELRSKLMNEEFTDMDEVIDAESEIMDQESVKKQFKKKRMTAEERERWRTQIVGKKIFKQHYPNFLTYQENLLIRHLYITKPDEWSIEALSEGFPVLPAAVMEIVKARWVLHGSDRIENHNKKVAHNWDLFKAGKMSDLPKVLVDHLNKFTSRDTSSISQYVIEELQPNFEVKTINFKRDFSKIITSYENLKKKKPSNDEEPVKLTVHESQLDRQKEIPDDKPLISYYKGEPITFDELKTEIRRKQNSGDGLTTAEHLIYQSVSEPVLESGTEDMDTPKIDLSSLREHPATKHAVENYFAAQQESKTIEYPQRIKIPKAIRKYDKIYRLNDCFYDHNGVFLYRVPGLF